MKKYKSRALMYNNDVNHPDVKQAAGRCVIARSLDDDCWQVFVEDDGELYRPDIKFVEVDTLMWDVANLNDCVASKLYNYFNKHCGLVLPIKYGKAHIDRFWNARFRKEGK